MRKHLKVKISNLNKKTLELKILAVFTDL